MQPVLEVPHNFHVTLQPVDDRTIGDVLKIPNPLGISD
jgi:hypothetical protein